jgi:hypothetical protein
MGSANNLFYLKKIGHLAAFHLPLLNGAQGAVSWRGGSSGGAQSADERIDAPVRLNKRFGRTIG